MRWCDFFLWVFFRFFLFSAAVYDGMMAALPSVTPLSNAPLQAESSLKGGNHSLVGSSRC